MEVEKLKILKYEHPFHLECGAVLPEIEIGYHTYGKLDSTGSNVVWICHALTANSDPMEWWPGLVGEGKLYDPDRHFIVCANTLGSCYSGGGSVASADCRPPDRATAACLPSVRGLRGLALHCRLGSLRAVRSPSPASVPGP